MPARLSNRVELGNGSHVVPPDLGQFRTSCDNVATLVTTFEARGHRSHRRCQPGLRPTRTYTVYRLQACFLQPHENPAPGVGGVGITVQQDAAAAALLFRCGYGFPRPSITRRSRTFHPWKDERNGSKECMLNKGECC